jgi:hypothetical protein
MVIRNNDGKPIGLLITLTSNEEVININSNQATTTITTRVRATGYVRTETFYGRIPLVNR